MIPHMFVSHTTFSSNNVCVVIQIMGLQAKSGKRKREIERKGEGERKTKKGERWWALHYKVHEMAYSRFLVDGEQKASLFRCRFSLPYMQYSLILSDHLSIALQAVNRTTCVLQRQHCLWKMWKQNLITSKCALTSAFTLPWKAVQEKSLHGELSPPISFHSFVLNCAQFCFLEADWLKMSYES